MKKENKLIGLLVIAIIIFLILLTLILLKINNKIEKQQFEKEQLSTLTTDNSYITFKNHLEEVNNVDKYKAKAVLIGQTASTSYVEIPNTIGANFVDSSDLSYSNGVFTALRDIDLQISFSVCGYRNTSGTTGSGYGIIQHNGTTIANPTKTSQSFNASASYSGTVSLAKGDTLTVKIYSTTTSYAIQAAFAAYTI